MKDFDLIMREGLELKNVDINTYSGLSLAYIGDAVYDLIIRSLTMSKGNMQVNKMHQMTSSVVCAVSQAKAVDIIMDVLTEEETSVYKRGRNTKPHTMAKNATTEEYKKATGFEALVGYLYIKGEYERLIELVRIALKELGEI